MVNYVLSYHEQSTLSTTAHVGKAHRDTLLGAWREQRLTPGMQTALLSGVCPYLHSLGAPSLFY